MTSTDKPTEIATWWGRHRQSHDRADLWSIGPIDLLCERRDNLWRLTWRHVHRVGSFPVRRTSGASGSAFGGRRADVFSSDEVFPKDEVFSALSRYYPAKHTSLTTPSTSPNEDLIFTPTYPTGQLRMELKTPVTLATGERLSLGLLIPLSILIEIAPSHGGNRAVAEIPIHPLAKTWNGPNPTRGDLALVPDPCLVVDRWFDHTPRLDYVACPVSLVNQGGAPNSVKSLLVPTARMALYHSPQTGFWSDTLHFDISESQPVKLEKTFPKDAGQPVLVSNPKQNPPPSAFLRERK